MQCGKKSFEIKSVQKDEGLVLFLKGRLDSCAVPELEKSVGSAEKVLLDFHQVYFIGSPVLAWLLGISRKVDLKIEVGDGPVHEVLRMSGVLQNIQG